MTWSPLSCVSSKVRRRSAVHSFSGPCERRNSSSMSRRRALRSADNARDLDLAMRWGYGWAQGPFETWQSAGWQSIADAVQADIDADRAMSTAALPAWVFARVEHGGVHRSEGSYSASGGTIKPPSTLPVYRRQLFPDRVFGEEANSSVMSGTTIWENEGVRLWTLPEIDNDIAIVSLTSKNHTLGHDVLLGMQEAVARAEAEYKGLVIWHEAPFAYGANLKEVAGLISGGQFDRIGSYIQNTHYNGCMEC